MRRDFENREALAAYLTQEFPQAARVDGQISPMRGGRKEAERLLFGIKPDRYGLSRNYLDGNITRLSPYIRHGVVTLKETKELALAKVKDRLQAAKFVTELAWRDYWQRLYAMLGKGL